MFKNVLAVICLVILFLLVFGFVAAVLIKGQIPLG
jgi:VIT1/CCC1 family predicted Fe2+/Mn2+ transporter